MDVENRQYGRTMRLDRLSNRGLRRSQVGSRRVDKQIATHTAREAPAASQWKKMFFLVSDAEQGVYFDG